MSLPAPRQRHVILVKHALPVLASGVPAREWPLAPEGEQQARALARELLEFLPFRLVSSPEPKAARTAELLGRELATPFWVQSGLEELDRPALPLLPAAEHAALNAPIFAEPTRPVLGAESGEAALERFSAALFGALAATPDSENLVAVTHGTVIALFVAAHNGIDAFGLWQRLRCPSFVVLAWPGLELCEVFERVA